MSVSKVTFKCVCKDRKLGVVDGDTDTVYCGNCEGAIGTIDELTIDDIKNLMRGDSDE